MTETYQDAWPLDPDRAHCNHGSFGAPPIPVLDAQRAWRDRISANPVQFYQRDIGPAIAAARAEIAPFLGADDIAFVTNATTGVNTVLAGFPLRPDNEVLITDHTYGAVALAVQRYCERSDARPRVVPLEFDADDASIVDAVIGGMTDRTRLVILDQITSPTARRMPIEAIIAAARERDIPVLVDGAHAPGIEDIRLSELGADFWTGNLHKWVSAPQGAGALWIAPRWREQIRPLVVSWNESLGFPLAFDQTGTADPTPWLAAPTAVRFFADIGWSEVRSRNSALAGYGQRLVADALGVDVPDVSGGIPMRLVPLDGVADPDEPPQDLQARIAEKLGVEVAITRWRDRTFLRVSAHLYNKPEDYQRLAEGIASVVRR